MAKLLVLGHGGMLGRTISAYLRPDPAYELLTITERWGESDFPSALKRAGADIIVNCIGKIPQKQPAQAEYEDINVALPMFLETVGVPVLHPSTDCEFSGTLPPGQAYEKHMKRDADDAYGKSKAKISERIENSFTNTKIIRTSIIGHEATTNISLLDWFLSQEGTIRGFTNHYWNGITALQWAKEMTRLIKDWDTMPKLTQLGTKEHHSKYELLTLAKDVYQKDNVTIEPFETDVTVNKCLQSDYPVQPLRAQLRELKTLFGR